MLRNLAIASVLLIFSSHYVAHAETLNCKNVKRLFEENRQALRKGYSVSRGNWLNCLKRHAIEAKRQYCSTSIQIPLKISLKKQLNSACTDLGFSKQ